MIDIHDRAWNNGGMLKMLQMMVNLLEKKLSVRTHTWATVYLAEFVFLFILNIPIQPKRLSPYILTLRNFREGEAVYGLSKILEEVGGSVSAKNRLHKFFFGTPKSTKIWQIKNLNNFFRQKIAKNPFSGQNYCSRGRGGAFCVLPPCKNVCIVYSEKAWAARYAKHILQSLTRHTTRNKIIFGLVLHPKDQW